MTFGESVFILCLLQSASISVCVCLSLCLFTESALRPIQSISRDVRIFVSLSLCLSLCLSHPRNHASRRIRDLWSKGISLILAYLHFAFLFLIFDGFFRFSKKSGFWYFVNFLSITVIFN